MMVLGIGVWKEDFGGTGRFSFHCIIAKGLLASVYTFTDIEKRAFYVVMNGIANDDVPSFACCDLVQWIVLASLQLTPFPRGG